MTSIEGKEFWRFDNGELREIPCCEERLELVQKAHLTLNHRGLEPVYYEMKKEWYWPGMKETIANVIKRCEVCQKINRKNTGGEKFIETSRRLEKVALDIVKIEDTYVLIAIDYFSRVIWTRVLERKSADKVIDSVKEWMKDGGRPVELITDNGKEFGNERFRRMCWDYGIEHRLASIEDHRSNGRVERAIRTLREGILKIISGKTAEKVEEATKRYNETYHSAIKCSPREAWLDKSGIAQQQNRATSRYAQRFVVRHREKFVENQEVRIAKRDNLGKEIKEVKGRFLSEGKVIAKCGNDSYLVKEKDRIVKKCHYDLKAKN